MRLATSALRLVLSFSLVHERNSDYQILLTRYALERLLYRLSVSAHSERGPSRNSLSGCQEAARTSKPSLLHALSLVCAAEAGLPLL